MTVLFRYWNQIDLIFFFFIVFIFLLLHVLKNDTLLVLLNLLISKEKKKGKHRWYGAISFEHELTLTFKKQPIIF